MHTNVGFLILRTENNAIINMGLRYIIYIDFNFSVYVIISGIVRNISNLTYESRFLKEKYAKRRTQNPSYNNLWISTEQNYLH